VNIKVISIDTGFNIPGFKNAKQLFVNKYTGKPCIITNPDHQKKMKAMVNSLSSVSSDSLTIDGATSITVLEHLATAWLQQDSSQMIDVQCWKELFAGGANVNQEKKDLT